MSKTKRRKSIVIFNQKGESLTETLVAILIAGLSMAMLAEMVSTSVNITDKSTRSFAAYYTEDQSVAAHTQGGEAALSGTAVFKSGTDDFTIGNDRMNIEYYVNQEAKRNPVISFQAAE